MPTTFRRVVPAAALACALVPASAQAAPGCGSTITHSTTLRADLRGCAGDGLVVRADNIRLDLGRHTVAGTGAVGSAGIRLAGHHGVTIRNGTVKGFGTGVALSGADRNHVRRLSLRGNGGRAVDARSSNRNAFTWLAASGNRTGVALTESTGNLVAYDVLRGNAITGVLAIGAARNWIMHNRIDGSSNGVALVEGSERDNVAANRISHADTGVDIDGSSRNVLLANELNRNGDGVLISSGDGNRVAFALVHGATARGIAVDDGAGNLLASNIVTGAAADGIAVAVAATGTELDVNVVSGSGDDGIDVDSAATTLFSSGAFRNHDLGIEAVPGVTDRGQNRARENGNAAQCSGVRCSGGQRGHGR